MSEERDVACRQVVQSERKPNGVATHKHAKRRMRAAVFHFRFLFLILAAFELIRLCLDNSDQTIAKYWFWFGLVLGWHCGFISFQSNQGGAAPARFSSEAHQPTHPFFLSPALRTLYQHFGERRKTQPLSFSISYLSVLVIRSDQSHCRRHISPAKSSSAARRLGT